MPNSPAMPPGASPPMLLADAGGRRVVAANREFVRSLRFVLERERAGSSAQVLKATGRALGQQFGAARDAALGAAAATLPLEACGEFLQSLFSDHGWGRLAIDLSGAGDYGIVTATLAHGFFADCGDEPQPGLNAFPAGVLLGYFEHITGQVLAGEEIGAAAAGPPQATFALSTPERIAVILPFLGRESAEQIIARLRT